MSVQYSLGKVSSVFIAALFAFALTSAIAASQFEGTWMTEDTKGKSFHINLSPDARLGASVKTKV